MAVSLSLVVLYAQEPIIALAEEHGGCCTDIAALVGGRPPQNDIVEATPVLYSAVPDDYDEDGIPIFYIRVSPDVWEQTFLYHPFYLGQTIYEDVIFILAYENQIEPHSNWCSFCGSRSVVLIRRWEEMATRMFSCAGLLGITLHWNILTAHSWLTYERCNACLRSTPMVFDWNERNWTWTVRCTGSARTFNVIVGSNINDHDVCFHGAMSIRASGVVHGFNCDDRDWGGYCYAGSTLRLCR